MMRFLKLHQILSPQPQKSMIRVFSNMSPSSMAVVYHDYKLGGFETKMVKMPAVEIERDDVCVRMLASPITPSDINMIEGHCNGDELPELPVVGGSEGVGVVHSVGYNVKNLFPGDWVIPFPAEWPWRSGIWQTYVVKNRWLWHKIKKGAPVEYAATVTGDPLVALRSLDEFVNLREGHSIVQNGALSTVGQCIIQLAREQGIHSINIIREGSDDSIKMLKELGADVVLKESQLGEKKNVKKLMENIPRPILGFDRDGDGNRLARIFFRKKGVVLINAGLSEMPTHLFHAQASAFKKCKKVSLGKWEVKHLDFESWLNLNAEEYREMIQKILEVRHEEVKLEKYSCKIDRLLGAVRKGKLAYSMELVPFCNFHSALDKATINAYGWTSCPRTPTVLIF